METLQGNQAIMEPIKIPIEDNLDLHTFRPQEVPDLLDDYFEECLRVGITSVRIIHGKGKGILKKRVHSLLKKHPLVVDFKAADPGAGGWGATQVELGRKTSTAEP
jgi:DNA-nicking Smr family endonuclease